MTVFIPIFRLCTKSPETSNPVKSAAITAGRARWQNGMSFQTPLGIWSQTCNGRTRADDRLMLNGVLWVLCSGAAWRDMPERFGPWSTVYQRFRDWRNRGTFEQVLKRLHIRLNEQGQIDLETWIIDSTAVRAARASSGAGKKLACPKAPLGAIPTIRNSWRKIQLWRTQGPVNLTSFCVTLLSIYCSSVAASARESSHI